MDQIAAELLEQSKIFLMAFGLGFARWFAFGSVFALFVWAGVSSGLARNAVAIGFGLPMTLLLFVTEGPVLATIPTMEYALLLAKEVVLGLLLGLVASVPIWIAELSGGVLAGLRQEEGGGSGFASTATARIFVLIAVGLLAYDGGLRLLIGAMYKSYVSWPVMDVMPTMGAQAGTALLMLLTLVFKAGFVIVGPFLLIFVLIDATVGVSGRLGKKFDVTAYSELFKMLAMLALLLAALLPLRDAISRNIQEFSDLSAILRTFFVVPP